METCLFCLESTALANNPVLCIDFTKYPDVCSCRVYSHIDCWMIYYLKKGYFECPICHKKCDQRQEVTTEGNMSIRTENIVFQITAPVPQIHIRERPSEEALRYNTLCCVCGCFCCFGFFFVCLFVPVVVFLKK